MVFFLNADDVLPLEAARRCCSAMGPGTSKVQLRIQRIDIAGRPRGAPFPGYGPVPTSGQDRQ